MKTSLTNCTLYRSRSTARTLVYMDSKGTSNTPPQVNIIFFIDGNWICSITMLPMGINTIVQFKVYFNEITLNLKSLILLFVAKQLYNWIPLVCP